MMHAANIRMRDVGYALWRAQFDRALEALTLEQMRRLQALMEKMGWAERDEPVTVLMNSLDEAERAEFLALDALLDIGRSPP